MMGINPTSSTRGGALLVSLIGIYRVSIRCLLVGSESSLYRMTTPKAQSYTDSPDQLGDTHEAPSRGPSRFPCLDRYLSSSRIRI